MGAERLFEVNKARLVEGADQTACIRDRAFDGGAVAWIGAQISRTQLGARKSRVPPERSRISSEVGVASSRRGANTRLAPLGGGGRAVSAVGRSKPPRRP